jgi:hypothetical protein
MGGSDLNFTANESYLIEALAQVIFPAIKTDRIARGCAVRQQPSNYYSAWRGS